MNLSLVVLAPASAILLAMRRYRALVISAAAILVLHTIGVIVASSSGPVAVACVHATLAAALTIPLLALGFGSAAVRPVGRAVRLSLPAVLIALVFPALVLLTSSPSGVVAAVALSAAGLLVYLLIGSFAWPSVGGRTLRLLLARG
jgi:hypothetical protein